MEYTKKKLYELHCQARRGEGSSFVLCKEAGSYFWHQGGLLLFCEPGGQAVGGVFLCPLRAARPAKRCGRAQELCRPPGRRPPLLVLVSMDRHAHVLFPLQELRAELKTTLDLEEPATPRPSHFVNFRVTIRTNACVILLQELRAGLKTMLDPEEPATSAQAIEFVKAKKAEWGLQDADVVKVCYHALFSWYMLKILFLDRVLLEI